MQNKSNVQHHNRSHKTSVLAVKLSKRRHREVVNDGHPWIFVDSIDKINKDET
jgi:hypothetical protein